MRLGQQINLLQTQKLIMTPELRQAINILQLNTLELRNLIQEQLVENPLLETYGEDQDNQEVSLEKEQEKEEFDIDLQEYFSDRSDLGYQSEPKETIPFENFITKSTSMEEYLEEQIKYFNLSDEDFALAQFIIGNLDERGYCNFITAEIAQQLEISEQKVEEIIGLIQRLEPPGIGARNLQECLIIQLRKKGLLTPILHEIITNYLDDLGQGRYVKVATNLEKTVREIQQLVDLLKTLNPKPGASFGSNQEVKFIVPDIIVKKIDEEYIILVNDISIPRLTINALYKGIMSNEKADKITKTFVERKFHGALWLIKSIEQRRLTLYRIASALVSLQRDFLDKGDKYLAPLSLKDVALEIGVHESTVSRAIANKYIQTPRGLFEMKYFFSTGLQTKSGDKISAQSIKKRIEDLVATENPKKPYSDQQIANILKDKGIQIARRTVAKYREELGILAAKQRKRY
ncbi:MAG: RNA polymerase factor sigma-54 [Clostridia bacterium]|nr:RNA polymerase factor sigma-54 [Clostridia bacterium]